MALASGSFGFSIPVYKDGNAFTVFKLKMGDFIGGGSISDVYIGHDLLDASKKKVVKIYFLEESRMASQITKLFLNEFQVMSRLTHPNILSVESAATFPDNHAILMEFCQHGALSSLIGKMSHPQMDSYFLQICNGLRYMHFKNIINRDIKLDNVLVSSNNTVKIADFDLSVILLAGHGQSMVFGRRGTRPYMAPEMVENPKAWYDGFKLDTYALGVLYWCMFFQRDVSEPENYLGVISTCHWQNPHSRCYRIILENLLCPVPERRWDMNQLVTMLTTIPWLAHKAVTL